jgi:hypothetical protein
LDQSFANLPASEQSARLHLNALQNFMLKLTELPGFNLNMVQRVKADLQARAVPLQGIENPFTLKLSDVNAAINEFTTGLGPLSDEEKNTTQRRARNAVQRLEILAPYLDRRVQAFKRSVDRPVRDMGTVMHLLLREEINTQKQFAGNANS